MVMGKDETRERWLATAVVNGDLRSMERALAAGANPDCADDGRLAVGGYGSHGRSVLQRAADLGDADALQILIKAGADVLAGGGKGVLSRVVGSGSKRTLEMMGMLLDSGVPVDEVSRQTQRTPLMEAARCGNTHAMEFLLKRGADVDAKDSFGATPLHMAAEGGHRPATELLIGWGASLSETTGEGETPLIRAARMGSLQVAKVLAEISDLGARCDNHWTAEGWAERNGHLQVAQMLAEVRERRDEEEKLDRGVPQSGARLVSPRGL